MDAGRRVSVGRVAGFVAGVALVAYLVAPLLWAGGSSAEVVAAEVRSLVAGLAGEVRVEGVPGVDSAGSWFEVVEVDGTDSAGNPVRVVARRVDPGEHRAESVSWFVSLPAVTGLRAGVGNRFDGVVDGRRVEVVLGVRIEGDQVVVGPESASVDGDPVALDQVRELVPVRRAPLPGGVSGVAVRGVELDGDRPRVELGANGVVTGGR